MAPRRRPAGGLWIAGFVLTAACLALAACGGGSSPTPTPSPSPEPTPSPTPAPPPTPTPPAPDSPYRLVYREFGQTQDTIWRVQGNNPANREQVAVIPHRQGWGTRPALSPDSRFLAYLSLPDYAIDAGSSQAEAYILDLKTQQTKKILDGVDLTFTPLWSPDGRWLYLRRLAGPEFLAADVIILRVKAPLAVDKDEPTPTPTPTPSPGQIVLPPEDPVKAILQEHVSRVLSFIPIGFAREDRSLYFVQIQGGTGDGTLLGAYEPAATKEIEEAEVAARAEALQVLTAAQAAAAAGITPTPVPPGATPAPLPTPRWASEVVVQLSDQLASDYDLSPDRNKVSFLAQQFADGQIVNRAFVADLVAAAVSPLPLDGQPAGAHLHPVWHPDGVHLAVGILRSDGQPGAVALVTPGGGPPSFLPAPEAGFDQPIAWDPAGTFLAVTHFSGPSLANPGVARLDLIAPTGQRVTVAPVADAEVLGWFQPPPSP